MLREIWRSFVRKHIVDDVPDEMAACFDCDVARCPDDKYETCPNRLAQATELGTKRTAMSTEDYAE